MKQKPLSVDPNFPSGQRPNSEFVPVKEATFKFAPAAPAAAADNGQSSEHCHLISIASKNGNLLTYT
jgi:hypothetical protein